MTKLIGHLRGNAVGYLALFVALGGTGYAAVSIPAGSVGTPQLRNGAVTAKKLNGRSIAGYVAFWARIDATGRVLAASAPTQTAGWASGNGLITVRQAVSKNCLALASAGPTQVGYVSTAAEPVARTTQLAIRMTGTNGLSTPLSVNVAEICP